MDTVPTPPYPRSASTCAVSQGYPSRQQKVKPATVDPSVPGSCAAYSSSYRSPLNFKVYGIGNSYQGVGLLSSTQQVDCASHQPCSGELAFDEGAHQVAGPGGWRQARSDGGPVRIGGGILPVV